MAAAAAGAAILARTFARAPAILRAAGVEASAGRLERRRWCWCWCWGGWVVVCTPARVGAAGKEAGAEHRDGPWQPSLRHDGACVVDSLNHGPPGTGRIAILAARSYRSAGVALQYTTS